jgi:hypothetical protein
MRVDSGCRLTAATKASHKVEREQFKACVLALQYGMSADGLANGLGNPRFAHANYCGCSGRSETSLICTHVSKTRADRPVTPSIPGDLLHRGEPPLSAAAEVVNLIQSWWRFACP